MKKKSLLIWIVLFFVLVLVAILWWLFGSGYVYLSRISKTWYITSDNSTYCFVLNKDGTGETKYYNSSVIAKFTYEITKDKLTIIESNGESETYLYEIKNRKLNMFEMTFYNNYEESVANQIRVNKERLNGEYNTEKFQVITQNELISKLENKEEFHLLVSRKECSYCRIFRFDAVKSVEDYDYELYYLDSSAINNYSLLHEYDENFDEKYIPTPTVFYIKDGKVINTSIGAVFYLDYLHFLRENGVKQR